MKSKTIKRALAILLAMLFVFTAVSCSSDKQVNDPEPSQTPEETNDETEKPVEVVADVPADRYDATVTPRTGNNDTTPLVLSTGTLDGKFSPFFATSAYDVDVYGMTQIDWPLALQQGWCS